MTSPDLTQVLERIGHGPLRFEWATWRRVYPCGVLSDERQVEAATQELAISAVLLWEAEEDARYAGEDPADRCLICFPEEAP